MGAAKGEGLVGLRRIGAGSFQDIKARLRALPTSMAHDVARSAAPVLTAMAREAFASGVNVYGDERPTGVDGRFLDLRDTGATEASLLFVANGSIMRCVLGPKYAKYLIGKYKILPIGDRTAIPVAWYREIVRLTGVAFGRRAAAAA
jgi:hypothetical protein